MSIIFYVQNSVTTPNADEDVGQQEVSLTAGGIAARYSHFGRQYGFL